MKDTWDIGKGKNAKISWVCPNSDHFTSEFDYVVVSAPAPLLNSSEMHQINQKWGLRELISD